MPMTEIVRYLNTQHENTVQALPGEAVSSTPFVTAHGRVTARYANLMLASRFHPIARTAGGQPYGHAASLHATNLFTGQVVDGEAVFVLPVDDTEFVYLDRLVRTLHTLNYLTHAGRGNLLLRVHQRHVLSVPANHGLAFEEILRPCGLVPEQLTLEIDIEGVEDAEHFVRAIHSYHARGYRVAIHRFGRLTRNHALLRELSPQIVRLDSRLLEAPESLETLTAPLREVGALTLIQGLDVSALRNLAATSGIDLLQALDHQLVSRRLLHA